jgi:hypothetical protein
VVLIAAGAAAGLAYAQFLEAPRQLWTDLTHDRNAHYAHGLEYAAHLRRGDLAALVRDFDGARVWGPLHGVLQGVLQATLGPDYRLAVLPSLLSWVGAACFGFLSARRLVQGGGNAAGLAAAIFILASPAHRAFATDVMLEGPGACLVLAALYFYVVAVQELSPGPGRLLGLTLTILFTLKYNYWLLVVLALVLAEASRRRAACRAGVARAWETLRQPGWWAALLRNPLHILIVLLLVLAIVVKLTGGTVLTLGQRQISITTPHTLIHLAYLVFFVQFLRWWFRTGREWAHRLDLRARQLLAWHVWPVALWFLWPKRLSYFLWYLSPAQQGEQPQHDLFGGYALYFRYLREDYHLALGSVLLAAALTAIALLGWRRLRPGAGIFLGFLLIALVLTCHHPNRKSRFLHPWVAGMWVVAGAGLAQLLPSGGGRRWARVRPWLAAASVAALGLTQLSSVTERSEVPEGGPSRTRASTLDLTDAYLPVLTGSRQAAILSNMPLRFLCDWTFAERYAGRRPPETVVPYYGRGGAAENQQRFARWLHATRSDTLIFIDLPPGSPFHNRVVCSPEQEQLRDLLAAQEEFRLTQRLDLPAHGCAVTVWRRAPAVAGARGSANDHAGEESEASPSAP